MCRHPRLRNSERAHGELLTFAAVAALVFVGLVIPAAADASFLDEDFGSAGSVALDAAPNDVVVDRTGRILVALDGDGEIVVAAFDDSGAPDTSFGDDGVATVDLEHDATATALAVDPANRIIVGASHAQFQGAVVRLTSDGEPDPSYDGDGIDFTNAEVGGVLAQPDSKIVVTGVRRETGSNPEQFFRFARYTVAGDRDPSFSGDGVVEVRSGAPSSAGLAGGEVAIGADGRLVAMAYYNPCCQPNLRAALTTVTSAGAPITSFGTGDLAPGVARHGFYGSRPTGLVVQPDGKILFSGSTPQFEYPTAPPRVAQAVRLLTDGTADTGWGPEGAVSAEFFGDTGTSVGTSLALMSNGHVVLSAHARSAPGEEGQLAVARFLPTGALDPTFGLGGMAWTSYPSDRRVNAALAVDAVGRPTLTAWTHHPDTGAPVDPLLVRFLSSGGTPEDGGGGGGNGGDAGGEGDGGVAGGVAGSAGLQVHKIVVPKTIGGLIRRGVRVLASCDVRCKLGVKVKVSGAVRNRLGLAKSLVARGSAGAAANKRRWVTARLTGSAARAFNTFGGGGRLHIRVRAEGSEAQSATVSVAG